MNENAERRHVDHPWYPFSGDAHVPRRRVVLALVALFALIIAAVAFAAMRRDPQLATRGAPGVTASVGSGTATIVTTADVATTTTRYPSPTTIPTASIPATVPPMPTTTVEPTIESFDLRNRTYPSTMCPSYRPPEATFTLVNGETDARWGGEVAPGEPTIGVRIEEIVYGDLTGDRRREAAVIFTCFVAQSDGFHSFVTIMNVDAGAPHVLATLDTSLTNPTGRWLVAPDDIAPPVILEQPLRDDATHATIAFGLLTVVWDQWDLGGDDFETGRTATLTYQLTGDSFTIVGVPDVVHHEYAPGTTVTGVERFAIRQHDVGSVVLPLAAADRTADQRVFPALFDPLGAVADGPLHDGFATVTDLAGTTLGTAQVEEVHFGDATHDGREDAALFVRGTSVTGASLRVPVIVTLIDERLVVIGSPTDTTADHSVVSVSIGGYDDLVITWNSPGLGTTWQTGYRWEAGHYVAV